MRIESPANPRIKAVVKLRQRSRRDEAGKTLVEGFREIRCALGQGHPLEELFFCPDFFLGDNEPALIEQAVARGAVAISCAKRAFEKISYRDRPDGLLAVARQVVGSLESLDPPAAALILVAEAVEKPGNLGTILRSADAAGAAAVLVCDPTTDVNNPNVVRASLGTLFCLPVVETSSQQALVWLKQQGFFVVAASPHAERTYSEITFPARTALIVGSEQYGLGELWMKECDAPVRIPMFGRADSLNVASSATILLYEAVRQRPPDRRARTAEEPREIHG
jgi:RNA methyltransferase, TrmH family